MSAFQQALANAVNQPAPSSSGSVSIRGAASARPSRGGGRGGSSSRSHAHNTKGTPYSKAPTEREGGRRRAYAPGGAQEPSVLSLAARIGQPGSGGGRGGAGAGGRPGDPRRNPVGTRGKDAHVRTGAQRSAHAKLSEKLGSEDMKAWLRNRVVKPGVVDMSVGRARQVVSLRLTGLGARTRSLAHGARYPASRAPRRTSDSGNYLLEAPRSGRSASEWTGAAASPLCLSLDLS